MLPQEQILFIWLLLRVYHVTLLSGEMETLVRLDRPLSSCPIIKNTVY